MFVALQIILESYLNKTFMKLSEKCVTIARYFMQMCVFMCVCECGTHSVVQTTNAMHPLLETRTKQKPTKNRTKLNRNIWNNKYNKNGKTFSP